MTLIYPLISCLIFSVEIQIQNHDDKIVKISLDKGEVDDDLENRVVVLQEEKVPGRGNKSISTQLKQQVKDLPRLEFELACPQNKVISLPWMMIWRTGWLCYRRRRCLVVGKRVSPPN